MMLASGEQVSVVIPAKNEATSVGKVVANIKQILPLAEIVVVDDGSSDSTAEQARSAGAMVVSHSYSKGNGAAVKAGARAASRDVLVFMDADGQHDPQDISRLLEKMRRGYDMAVGARGVGSQASVGRGVANRFYNWFSSKIVGRPILDLTSGFRAVDRRYFLRYLYLLPNGFSYPTTITMAFFRAGYSVGYVPIIAARRIGKSHIRLFRDGVRFLLIIFKVGTLYSPLKIFTPISAFQFGLGLVWYAHTYFSLGRFTNMSAFLMVAAVQIFLIGLISEQITQLMYAKSDSEED